MKPVMLVLSVLLGGCVSESTVLRNPEGKTYNCDAWGFGVIGAPVAMAQHSDCVNKAHAAGYTE